MKQNHLYKDQVSGTNIQTCFHRQSSISSQFLDFLVQRFKHIERRAIVGKNVMDHHTPNSEHIPLPFKTCIRSGYHGPFAI